MGAEPKCPFGHAKHTRNNSTWWPDQLNLDVLHQHSARGNPLGEGFDYAQAFAKLDLDEVVRDLRAYETGGRRPARCPSRLPQPVKRSPASRLPAFVPSNLISMSVVPSPLRSISSTASLVVKPLP